MLVPGREWGRAIGMIILGAMLSSQKDSCIIRTKRCSYFLVGLLEQYSYFVRFTRGLKCDYKSILRSHSLGILSCFCDMAKKGSSF